jgi:hypothetical protein
VGIVARDAEVLLHHGEQQLLEVGFFVPPVEGDRRIVASGDLRPDVVGSRRLLATGEPCGEVEVGAIAAHLPAVDGELRVAPSFLAAAFDDVDEGATGADWGQLPRVANEDQPLGTGEGIDGCGQLVLGEHRRFVDDHGPSGLRLGATVDAVDAGVWVLTTAGEEELRDRARIPSGRFL